MKIRSAADALELLGACVPSTVLGLALELGLFWKLADTPSTVEQLARDLDIPLNRCRYWVDLLVDLELLRNEGNTYSISEAASTAILSTLSRNAWSDLASQSRESYRKLTNLPEVIHEPGSALAAQGIEDRTYVQELKDSPEKARRFTHMLLEIHRPLAHSLAEVLTMDGEQRLMDLGGGSGVMSNAILSRNPGVFGSGLAFVRKHPQAWWMVGAFAASHLASGMEILVLGPERLTVGMIAINHCLFWTPAAIGFLATTRDTAFTTPFGVWRVVVLATAAFSLFFDYRDAWAFLLIG